MSKNKPSKLFRNEKGFTLVEVLVSVGILAIVSLGVGAVIQTVFSRQANIVNKSESNELVSSLGKWFQTASGCGLSLTGIAAPNSTERAFVIRNYKGFASNAADIQDDFKVNNQLTIKKLTIKDKGAPGTTVRLNNVNYTRLIAQIKVSFEEKLGAAKTEQRSRFIEVPVLVGPDNLVAQCHIDQTMEEACSAMGGTYVESTKTCRPQSSCQLKGTFVNLSCSPKNQKCKQSFTGSPLNVFTKAASCPAGSSPSLSGQFIHTHSVSCGKKCSTTVTNKEDYYICVQCS